MKASGSSCGGTPMKSRGDTNITGKTCKDYTTDKPTKMYDILTPGYYTMAEARSLVIQVKPGRDWTVEDAMLWVMQHGHGWHNVIRKIDAAEIGGRAVIVLGE